MARVQEVSMVEVPPAPKPVARRKAVTKDDLLVAKKEKLNAVPELAVVESVYVSEISDADLKKVAKKKDLDASDLDAVKASLSDEEIQEIEENKSRGAARNAAYQINAGTRTEWPSETYYGVFRKTPEKDGGEGWQLVVGLRTHLPEEWAQFVSGAGSRKKASEAASSSEVADEVADPFVDEQDDAA